MITKRNECMDVLYEDVHEYTKSVAASRAEEEAEHIAEIAISHFSEKTPQSEAYDDMESELQKFLEIEITGILGNDEAKKSSVRVAEEIMDMIRYMRVEISDVQGELKRCLAEELFDFMYEESFDAAERHIRKIFADTFS